MAGHAACFLSVRRETLMHRNWNEFEIGLAGAQADGLDFSVRTRSELAYVGSAMGGYAEKF